MRRNCASQVTFRKSATRSERACAFLGAVCLPAFLGLLTLTPLPDCAQDHRRGVVIVRHLALSSLPDQLFPGLWRQEWQAAKAAGQHGRILSNIPHDTRSTAYARTHR